MTLILAWAIVESETTESWTWFAELLKLSIPEISDIVFATTIISDRGKGLVAAEKIFGKYTIRAYCAFHICQNLVSKHGKVTEGFFWAIAKASTEAEFDEAMAELKKQSAGAATYLKGAKPENWARAKFKGSRYGYLTSNIVEVVDSNSLTMD